MFAGIRASLKTGSSAIRHRRAQPRQPARRPAAQGAVPRQVRQGIPGHPPQPHRAGLRPLRPRPAGARKDVEEALNLLEQQTYIQRNGNVYEYLTNEEQDIEQEIKNTEVESADVMR